MHHRIERVAGSGKPDGVEDKVQNAIDERPEAALSPFLADVQGANALSGIESRYSTFSMNE
jgi:hypothetical protein